MNTASTGLSCKIVTDADSLLSLEGAWNALYDRVAGPYLSDSFDWARMSWELICAPRGRDLCCLVVEEAAGVAAILPLVRSWRGLWRIASPLNSEASEYCPFLIDPRLSAAEVMEAAFRTLKQAGVDALNLPNVREDEPLGGWLAGRSDATRTLTLPAARIRIGTCGSIDDYLATRSTSMRAELRRKLRMAERLGDLEFCEVTDPLERQDVWRWLVERKKAALVRQAKRDWLLSPQLVDFAAATLEPLNNRRPLFAVRLDGEVIAAGLCSAGATRVEGFVMAYDERHAKISPGALLQMQCVRWAIDRGLDFDLRTGHEAFKSSWANEFSDVSSFVLPVSWIGRSYVLGERARRGLSKRIPQSLRAKGFRWLEGLRGRNGAPPSRAPAGAAVTS